MTPYSQSPNKSEIPRHQGTLCSGWGVSRSLYRKPIGNMMKNIRGYIYILMVLPCIINMIFYGSLHMFGWCCSLYAGRQLVRWFVLYQYYKHLAYLTLDRLAHVTYLVCRYAHGCPHYPCIFWRLFPELVIFSYHVFCRISRT